MMKQFQSTYDQIGELERAVEQYAHTNNGLRLFVAPLQAARRRIAKVSKRVAFMQTARQKGIRRIEWVELDRIRRTGSANERSN